MIERNAVSQAFTFLIIVYENRGGNLDRAVFAENHSQVVRFTCLVVTSMSFCFC